MFYTGRGAPFAVYEQSGSGVQVLGGLILERNGWQGAERAGSLVVVGLVVAALTGLFTVALARRRVPVRLRWPRFGASLAMIPVLALSMCGVTIGVAGVFGPASIRRGQSELRVELRDAAGARVPGEVWISDVAVASASLRTMLSQSAGSLRAAGADAQAYVDLPSGVATFPELRPATYTICGLALPPGLPPGGSDSLAPEVWKALREEDQVPVVCRSVAVDGARTRVELVVVPLHGRTPS
jgi:hypothetical protein